MNDNDDAFGIRDGEVAIGLPDTFDASLYFIGRIRTPWTRRADCPKNARESDAVCTLEVDPRWAKALTHVESCTHLVVLYWMNRSRRDLVLQVPRHYGIALPRRHAASRHQALFRLDRRRFRCRGRLARRPQILTQGS